MTDSPPLTDISALLQQIQTGQEEAVGQLYQLVYEELCGIARKLIGPDSSAGVSAGEIVQEAFQRMQAGSAIQQAENRRYFFAAAASAMRRILVERARARLEAGPQGTREPHSFDPVLEQVETQGHVDMLQLDAALQQLERSSPGLHQVVMLRFFTGLSVEETALALSLSPGRVEGDWRQGRARLYRVIKG